MCLLRLFWLTALVCSLVWVNTAQAQPQAMWWHFGFGLEFDFKNSACGTLSATSPIETFEGSASISDSAGNLLFFTNGGGRGLSSGQQQGYIWDANGNVLPNGDLDSSHGGGWSSAQSSVFVPNPGNPNQYYLFTMDEVEYYIGGNLASQPMGKGLRYFLLDKTLNGGLGDVVPGFFDVVLKVPSFENLGAIRHANGTDYWVAANTSWGSISPANLPPGFTPGPDSLLLYLVTAAGVQPPISYPGLTTGTIHFSPDGQWLATGSQLYPFDASTGTLGTPVNLPAASGHFSFSPNAKILYTHESAGFSSDVYQYRIDTTDIANSGIVVGNADGLNALQLAPNGQIYINTCDFFGGGASLHHITCPNVRGVGCGFGPSGIAVPGTGDCSYNLPNFEMSIFFSPDTQPIPPSISGPGQVCPGPAQVFTASVAPLGGCSTTTFAWVLNGANTISGPTNGLSVNIAYSVTAVDTLIFTQTSTCLGARSDTLLINFVPGGSFSLNLGPDTSLCLPDSLVLSAPPGFTSYAWSTGETTPSIVVSDTGTYAVEVASSCGTGRDTVKVIARDTTVEPFSLGPDQVVCFPNILLLQGPVGFDAWTWSTGETTPDVSVSGPGTYWVLATSPCRLATDSLNIAAQAIDTLLNLIGPDTLQACLGDSIAVDAATGWATYAWSNGATGAGTLLFAPGSYTLQAGNPCQVGLDTVVAIFNINPAGPMQLGPDTLLCDGENLVLTATPGYASYLWQDGSSQALYTVTTAGTYGVTGTNPCGSSTDSVTVSFEDCTPEVVDTVFTTNVFTPNGDGANDAWLPGVPGAASDVRVGVFDRWGREVFTTRAAGVAWNGQTSGGSDAPEGVYVFVLEFTLNGETLTRSGTLSLLR